MKVLHRRGGLGNGLDEGPPAPAPAAAAKPTAAPKIMNRAAPPPAPKKKTREEQNSEKVAALLGRLAMGVHDEHCDGHTDLAGVIQIAGFASLQANGLLVLLKEEADSADADARECAMLALEQLCDAVGRPCEAYVVPMLPVFLERLADKVQAVREAAMAACMALVKIMCPHAVELVMPSEQGDRACAPHASMCSPYVHVLPRRPCAPQASMCSPGVHVFPIRPCAPQASMCSPGVHVLPMRPCAPQASVCSPGAQWLLCFLGREWVRWGCTCMHEGLDLPSTLPKIMSSSSTHVHPYRLGRV